MSLKLIEKCNEYISHERQCSEALAGSVSLMTAILDLEKTVIDAVTGGLTTTVCYVATFVVKERFISVCN